MIRWLIWLIRVYIAIIIIWVVLSWIPLPLPLAFHNVLNILVKPVWLLFGWLTLGFVGFAPAIAVILLTLLERWLLRFLPESQLPREEEPLSAAENTPPSDQLW